MSDGSAGWQMSEEYSWESVQRFMRAMMERHLQDYLRPTIHRTNKQRARQSLALQEQARQWIFTDYPDGYFLPFHVITFRDVCHYCGWRVGLLRRRITEAADGKTAAIIVNEIGGDAEL